jgi:hypothetical protein
MRNLTAVVFAILTLTLGACGGSASVGARANTADGAGASADIDPNARMDAVRQDTPTPDEGTAPEGDAGTGTNPPAPTPTNGRLLPPECDGNMPKPEKLAEGTLVCRCVKDGNESVWSTFVWDKDENPGYPGCVIPFPAQVLRRKISLPLFEADPSKNPYTGSGADTEKTTTTTAATTTASTTKVTGWQLSCDVEAGKSVICLNVQHDGKDVGTYQCLGPNIRRLTAAEKAAYNGGAPCGCKAGKLSPMGTPKNSWQCK